MSSKLVIDLDKVEKTYGRGAGHTKVLKQVSLSVESGEFIALVGQSGSGKSTLLNIIGGLDVADAGSVHVLGHDYGEIPEGDLARVRNRDIGFVFQSFNLLDHLTVLGNVTLPASFDREVSDVTGRGMDKLERVGLAEFAERTPVELSGGQKQRVAIARALFNEPKLLLCDEPTGNLDSDTGRDVIEFFQRLNEEDGTTLLIVTHEERVSSAARRVTRIMDGAMVEGDDSPVARDRTAAEGGAS